MTGHAVIGKKWHRPLSIFDYFDCNLIIYQLKYDLKVSSYFYTIMQFAKDYYFNILRMTYANSQFKVSFNVV